LLAGQCRERGRRRTGHPGVAARAEGDPLEGARIMVNGMAVAAGDEATRARYLARHPSAARFAHFADFSFMRIEPAGLHLVAGFGRITDLWPRDFLTGLAGAEKLLAAEAEAVAHMNADHGATLSLYAQKLCNAPDGAWRCVACDPEGLDMQCGNHTIRLTFPARVTDPAALRKALKALADQARAAMQ
jgi:putative heme iron utilization protein